jgi:purine-cytosine permease-like protein
MAETPPNPYRQMQSDILLRTGITFFAALAGLACYYGAKAIGLQQTIAVVAGLLFALLVWIAARSLVRELRAEIRREQSENQDERHR